MENNIFIYNYSASQSKEAQEIRKNTFQRNRIRWSAFAR